MTCSHCMQGGLPPPQDEAGLGSRSRVVVDTLPSGRDAGAGMADSTNDDIGRIYWGYGIGLLALAWFSAPLIRYADAVALARCGVCAFLVILTLERSHRAHSAVVRQVARGAFFGTAAMTVLFAGQLFFAARTMARDNDRRCAVIEGELLRATPRRDDLADMFQAFGCRPQSSAMPRRP